MISGVKAARKAAWLPGVLLALGLGCCESPTRYTQLEGQAQGTTFRIVYDSPGDHSVAIDSLFRVIDRSMSLWDSTSIISGFNANRPGVRADEHFETVFAKAQEVARQTGGAFDVSVGPLVKAWGFSRKTGRPLPTPAQVDSLLKMVGFQSIDLKNGILLKKNPQAEVDLNAIAQGYTVDVVAAFLKKKGIAQYLIEIGGEVRAAGRNERGQVWQIGIEKPTDSLTSERPLQTVVSLQDKALATSGSYRKFVIRDGQKFSHAIDPDTGYPITHRLLSVSVKAADCMTADAYATAFLVLGLEKAKPIARRLHLEFYGIVSSPDGTLKTYATPGFF